MTNSNGLNFIDLFAGCGGLGEGFIMQGFNPLAHIEWESPMVDTLRANLIKRHNYSEEQAFENVVEFDVQKTNELFYGNWKNETKEAYGLRNSNKVMQGGLDEIIGNRKVDLIIGGPPCQAYSIAGRAQDPNSMKNDYRNYLFESFVAVVKHYKPTAFVFENVPGMLSAKPGDRLVIERVYEAFEEIGYSIRKPQELKKSIFCASDYKVPQNRNRVIIFGVHKGREEIIEKFYDVLEKQKCQDEKKTVRDAIGWLPKFRPLIEPYKLSGENISHELIGDVQIPLHVSRYHNKRDQKVFVDWILNSMNNISNEEKLAYYKKVSGKETNHNKYRSLEWDLPSPTIVSHLNKDGLMFIHPDASQARSITIREAALLQTFPMDYEFLGSKAYCYKMIGNAVPVLFAEQIALAVKKVIGDNK